MFQNKLVTSKSIFYEVQKLGWFNTPRYWDSINEVDTQGTITARDIVSPAGNTIYIKSVDEMKTIVSKLSTQQQNGLIFLEDPPMDRLIQGEFTHVNGSWFLAHNRYSDPLGKAMRRPQSIATGFQALKIMRDNVDGASFDDMMLLMEILGDKYNVETPVIEFSTYPIPVGILKGRNTIIWEVRSY